MSESSIRLHARSFAGLHDAGQHEGFRVADDGADSRGVRENLQREDAAAPVLARDELLGDDAAQRFADHDADLLALIGRENVEHAVERARGVAGVQRAEHQVAGFRGGDGELDGFQVAHFADHDDVRIFTQARRARPRRMTGCACAPRAG